MRGLIAVMVASGLALVACHPTDRPPLPPPSPTNPSTLALLPAGEILDASIVTEGGTGWDGAPPVYPFDAGRPIPGPTR
jgi:hypothetical protein